jgi:glycyl-tRNA synthetase beta chain
MADFLFEIGLEEVPARMISGAQAELQQRVVKMLERERLVRSGAMTKSFATPRRLAVWVKDVAERQEDVAEELVGPSVKIAYKDGVATPAAVAFAKKAGLDVAALKTVTNAKGEYLAATVAKAGRGAAEVIAAEMPKELAGIYWAKNMYWRPGKPERFVRPVRWMVTMLGTDVVPVSFGGYEAGAVTYGHRVLFGNAAIALNSPGEYEDALLSGFVIADVEVRRQRIRKALDKVTRAGDTDGSGLRWREDHGLVDKLTQLTEWPSVLMGGFEAEYLALPEEVLVTVMRDHQSYFAVEDNDGKLAPHFLAVLNTETDAAGMAVIRHGNERVLRARFNDAKFFWEFDQRVPLVDRVKLLENVTFQKDLGSYAAKAERVRALGKELAKLDSRVDAKIVDDAARLAKTDLTTELVKEFTELQGVVGGLYARAQGLSEQISDAIYDQYLPVAAQERVPRSYEGAILGIADRLDTIVGMFGLGLEPTGSKDPFALRRAANGIVKIWVESHLTLLTVSIVDAACKVHQNLGVATKVSSFIAERIAFYLREVKGQSYDVVSAVMAASENDVRNGILTCEAITSVRVGEHATSFLAVCAAFKRMKNILTQAGEKGEAPQGLVDPGLFVDNAERTLDTESARAVDDVEKMRLAGNRTGALLRISELHPFIDAFFEAVMVMDPDAKIRKNRLALLARVLSGFSRIADFSEIVVAG